MRRKAKIVATIGPASEAEEAMEKLLLAGMDVARLNFSHGDHSTHEARTKRLRAAAKRLGRPLAILQDLQGPKVRVGVLQEPITLQAGQQVILYPEGQVLVESGPSVPVDFPELFRSVRQGDRILLDDGKMALQVLAVKDGRISARVVTGGVLSSHKGINLPGVRLEIPAFTEKDAADLEFGLSLGVDAVAVSFVQKEEDVQQVKDAIRDGAPAVSPLVIAKLERPEALENLDAILDVSDGVMVARGDLGVEMAPEDVPGLQKRIIRAANQKRKLVITATQMLESMIHSPLPTRAEVSDVANAVFDGTDAVMLSAETAVGEYPVESVTMMDRIVRQAEADFAAWGHEEMAEMPSHDDAVALSYAAHQLARDRDVAAIAVFTRMGRSAWLMAKSRPCVPILAFTPEECTYRRLALAWGVYPTVVPFANTMEEMLQIVEEALRASEAVEAGQQVVLVCGFPVGEMRPPNMALLHTVR